MDDLISRQAAVDALNGIINRFEQILRDIRESKVDDSVCGMCEYDGAYMGQSGDWCNECPGFDKDDCFKLSDKCRKRWLKSVDLPSAQPVDKDINVPTNDIISRQAAIDAVKKNTFRLTFAEERNCEGHVAWSANAVYSDVMEGTLLELPSVQPEQKSVIYYGDGYSDGAIVYDEAECPSCGRVYDQEDSHVWGAPFCLHCGQALYWEGEKDEGN